MKEKKIVNPEVEYFIVSLKHTNKKDKYVTLWRPDNAGYAWPLELAGKYKGYEEGYHHDDENIPVPVNEIPTKFLVKDDRGRDCIKVSKASVEFFLLYKV